MNRRSLLLAIGTVAASGCISRDPDQGTGREDGTSGADAGATTGSSSGAGVHALAIEEVCPKEVERPYVDYENVKLLNEGDEPVDVAGVDLVYDADLTYALPDLRMEPGASLVVRSRASEPTKLLSAPPIYMRSANVGEGTSASAMDGSGTVRLEAPDGSVIDEATYSESTTCN